MCLNINSKKENGFTLIEMMIATAVASIIGLGIAIYLSQQQRTVKQIESNLRMNHIARQVQRGLGDVKTLLYSAQNSSAPGNQALATCIQATASNNWCKATDPSKPQSFDLIFPVNGNASPAQLDANTLAGHDIGVGPGPSYYQLMNGTHCSRIGSMSPHCNVLVRAFFWATCPPPAGASQGTPGFTQSSCPRAETLHFLYQVSYSPKSGAAGTFDLKVSNIPDDKAFYANGTSGTLSTRGAITISASAFPYTPAAPIVCPKNSTVTGVVNGVAQCACMYPYKQIDPFCKAGVNATSCACTDIQKQCATDERYRGMCPATGGGNCSPGDIICCQVFTQWVPATVGCQQGGRVETVKLVPVDASTSQDACTAASECKIGKWGGTCQVTVNCNEMQLCVYDFVPAGAPPGTTLNCGGGH